MGSTACRLGMVLQAGLLVGRLRFTPALAGRWPEHHLQSRAEVFKIWGNRQGDAKVFGEKALGTGSIAHN